MCSLCMPLDWFANRINFKMPELFIIHLCIYGVMPQISLRVKFLVLIIVLAECIMVLLIPPAVASDNPAARFTALSIALIVGCYLILLTATSQQALHFFRNFEYASKRKRSTSRIGKVPDSDSGKDEQSLASRIIFTFTLGGRLMPYLPLFGIFVIIAVVWYNASYGGWHINETDTTAFLFGAMLIAFRYVPKIFSWERDFMMIFSSVLALILVVPLMVLRAFQGDPASSVNVYSSVLLGPSLVFILNLIGIKSYEGAPPPGPGNEGYPWIYYSDIFGAEQRVGISAVCAGLYSFSIFVALFTAYVLVRYKQFRPGIAVILALGFITSYVANIFRMTIIVMVSYYYGPGMLVWMTHEYTGILIFLLWLTVFWHFIFRYMKDTSNENAGSE